LTNFPKPTIIISKCNVFDPGQYNRGFAQDSFIARVRRNRDHVRLYEGVIATLLRESVLFSWCALKFFVQRKLVAGMCNIPELVNLPFWRRELKCQLFRLPKSILPDHAFVVAEACNHPNCLVLPFSVELIRLAA
jgi:hypothetical protein